MTKDPCALSFELGATEFIMFPFCTPSAFSSRILRRNPPVQRWAEGGIFYQAEYKEQSFPVVVHCSFCPDCSYGFSLKSGQVFERWCCSLEALGPEPYPPWVIDSGLLEINTATISGDSV